MGGCRGRWTHALERFRASLAAGSVAATLLAKPVAHLGSAVTSLLTFQGATSSGSHKASGFASRATSSRSINSIHLVVYDGNCPWFKRPDYGRPPPGTAPGQVWRSLPSRIPELTTPIHLGFKQSFSPTGLQAPGPAACGQQRAARESPSTRVWKTSMSPAAEQPDLDDHCAYCWVATWSRTNHARGSTASDGTAGPGETA